MQEELRDRAVLLGQGEYSYSNLRYSSKHSAPMVLVNSIPDIVHEYVELFFRSEMLQMYCLKWAHLLKKLLLGYNPMDELKEAARKVWHLRAPDTSMPWFRLSSQLWACPRCYESHLLGQCRLGRVQRIVRLLTDEWDVPYRARAFACATLVCLRCRRIST
jgi:hypothetical protein